MSTPEKLNHDFVGSVCVIARDKALIASIPARKSGVKFKPKAKPFAGMNEELIQVQKGPFAR